MPEQIRKKQPNASSQGPYKIVTKEDDTTKVVLTNKAHKPSNVLMPGVGKVVGSLAAAPKNKMTTVLNPHTTQINNNIKKPSRGGGAGTTVQQTATQWRCAVCKFANPTYVLDEETGKPVEPKVLVEKCTRCRDPKKVMKETGPAVATAAVRMRPPIR